VKTIGDAYMAIGGVPDKILTMPYRCAKRPRK